MRVATSRAFLALGAALAVTACVSYAVVVNLVPLLTDRGFGLSAAAVVLGLGGAGQVAGRLVYPALSRRLVVRARTVTIVAGVAISTGLVSVLTGPTGLVVAVVLAGMVRGMMTLLQATAVSDRWGTGQYGRLTGLLSAPVMMQCRARPVDRFDPGGRVGQLPGNGRGHGRCRAARRGLRSRVGPESRRGALRCQNVDQSSTRCRR